MSARNLAIAIGVLVILSSLPRSEAFADEAGDAARAQEFLRARAAAVDESMASFQPRLNHLYRQLLSARSRAERNQVSASIADVHRLQDEQSDLRAALHAVEDDCGNRDKTGECKEILDAVRDARVSGKFVLPSGFEDEEGLASECGNASPTYKVDSSGPAKFD